jgi:phospholipid/cholesterol/gamma-HCH transport system substrate-binding protein
LRIKSTAPITAATVATITCQRTRNERLYRVRIHRAGRCQHGFQRLTTRPGERYPSIATAPSKSVTLDTTIFKINENVQILTELLQSYWIKTP